MARPFAMARQRTLRLVLRKRALYLMMIPGIAFLFAFNYMPMYGAIIAFRLRLHEPSDIMALSQ